ncbi:MAG: transporter substrate-binding domain-containing protein [Bauldia sp.]
MPSLKRSLGLGLIATLAPTLAACSGALAAETPAPADEPLPAVVIPNFWDPRQRIERPPAGAVQAIRFLTTDDFPPFNFVDENGHLTGFNVDLARAICAELAVRCTIQARQWDDLAGHIVDKSADAIIAGVAVTAENREWLDFSDVYLRPAARFAVLRESGGIETTPTGLRGKTLAVVTRTAHEAYLAAMFPEVGRKLYPTAEAARQALKNGDVDAHFGDGLQLSFWLESRAAGACCTFAGGPFLESRFFGQGHAIAIAKAAPDLKRAINAALQAVHEKGVYGELYLRYFPIGFF